MDFKVKSWGWVGDIYHKVESMIQEVDDIMKEKADSVGQNTEDSSENKKKFSTVETQASLQQVKEIHSPLTDGKKLDSCFREMNDTDTAIHKLSLSHDVDSECVPPNAAELSRDVHSSVNPICQELREPPLNGIIVECDESEEGHTEATSNCKSTLNCSDEASQLIIRHSEIAQYLTPYFDQKGSESEAATGEVSRHSSMSLGFPSEIGDVERPTASAMTRNLQEDESKDSGSRTPSLVDLMKETSIESPGTAASGINEPVPLAKLLEEEKRQFQDWGALSAYLVDTDMETIDLDDKVELQESCASIDVRDLLAVSERVKRFRSIKRKILDAFASRRRTAKEYEQLGILHGDLNFEHRGNLVLNTVSFQGSRSSIEHPVDSDWELL